MNVGCNGMEWLGMSWMGQWIKREGLGGPSGGQQEATAQ